MSWHFDQAAIDAEAAAGGWYALLTRRQVRKALAPTARR
jgi:hypothetical protein